VVTADAAWHKAGVSSTEDEYWNRFYSHAHQELEAPSSFALHVMGGLAPGQRLFELGCGNGRDALFFASRGLRVTACDRSKVAVETLQARPDLERFAHRPEFLVADFVELDRAYRGEPPNVVYSRFTLHAVPAAVQSAALGWARRALAPGGKLLIEVRSVKGSLYGKGEPVERDAFLHDGHYRRFVRIEELTSELTKLGFGIDSASESSGVAVYRDDDPVVIRLVASSPSSSSSTP
jgi:ubiquinone/menaquinone biosynthesis C-methylase UbiE